MNGSMHKKKYTVKELANLAGVTVRTLHLYDKIGLLSPEIRSEARYRYYGEKELLLLQQILFYKELDFPLKDIIEILKDPDFDLIKALENHKSALTSRRKKIAGMLETIDKTILNLKGKIKMKHEDLYTGLPKEKAEKWRQEALEKWPKQVKQSEQALLKLNKQEFEKLKSDFGENIKRLAALRKEHYANPAVQKEIGLHYGYIQKFWSKKGDIGEAYKGLGQLYVDDNRYTEIDGKPNPDFALFLRDAMTHYVDSNL